ncbi:transcription factor bHLH84 [Prunus yedoensis var. nudiflora]|uniref:Transcription factor bHLH84 n=1 Tax=Prunus yedoensis var. nudiflora TaxID=2094558 RepID=A0A314Y990_PRUYE|nr:transcription factor bHLH84 [Prunus yedoensis var. nudiflora]
MEHIGVVAEGEWTTLSGMCTAEEVDFMAQLLGNFSSSNHPSGTSSMRVPDTFWPGDESLTMNMSGNHEGSHYSSETSISDCSNRILFPTSSNESYYLSSDSLPILVTSNSSMSIDFGSGDGIRNLNSYLIEVNDQCLNQEPSEGKAEEYGGNQPEAVVLGKRKYDMTVQEPDMDDKSNHSKNSMKGTQISENMNKRNIKSKKSLQIITRNNEEDGNAGPNRQSSSSYCSGDDSNIASHSHENSQELSPGSTSTSSLSPKEASALNLSGKSRARRGSATDPQSLYARKKKREINERLRVLQNIVPNGTKVDISTMLEEAVHYVKFLQLQIKLFSSDDMWMYAPICYNGMDLGLDLKLTSPKQS